MEYKLTYEELLQELKDNRDKKLIQFGEYFERFIFNGLGEAFYNGNLVIEWKGNIYYRSEMPEDIAKQIEDELFTK